jgi:acetyl-CoA carboxylase carboxyl transferase subunit beta
LTHLGHSTTGGVLASYASLGDVVLADPSASIDFAGPRVAATTMDGPLRAGSHSSIAAFANCLVDGLATPKRAPGALTRMVALLHAARRDGPLPAASRSASSIAELTVDEVVRRARDPERPPARRLLGERFDDSVELAGDRYGGTDAVAIEAVARLGAHSVVVGFDSGAINAHGRHGHSSAVAFRTIQRALTIARRHGPPVIALIDTNDADPFPASEAIGVAAAIAETFVAMLAVAGPTVAVVTGEGGSGGALAIGVTDRLIT